MSVEWDVAPFGKEDEAKSGGCRQRRRSEMRSLKSACFELAALHFCRHVCVLQGYHVRSVRACAHAEQACVCVRTALYSCNGLQLRSRRH